MSRKYKHDDFIPDDVLCNRLKELAHVVSKGNADEFRSEFTMRIPAELDRDADLVIGEAGRRIKRLRAELRCMEARALSAEAIAGITPVHTP